MDLSTNGNRAPKKKHILAVSHGFYRGVVIYEVQAGFCFYLGLWFHIHTTLQSATEAIDEVKDGKKKLH